MLPVVPALSRLVSSPTSNPQNFFVSICLGILKRTLAFHTHFPLSSFRLPCSIFLCHVAKLTDLLSCKSRKWSTLTTTALFHERPRRMSDVSFQSSFRLFFSLPYLVSSLEGQQKSRVDCTISFSHLLDNHQEDHLYEVLWLAVVNHTTQELFPKPVNPRNENQERWTH